MEQVHLASFWKTRSLLTHILHLESKTNHTSDETKPQTKSLHSCPICLKELSSEPILRRHYRETHKMNKDKKQIVTPTFSCPGPNCNSRPFKRKSQLGAHMVNVHNRKAQHGKKNDDEIRARALTGFREPSHLPDHGMFQGAQKAYDKPPGAISCTDTPMIPDTVGQFDWSPYFSEPHSNPVGSIDEIGSRFANTNPEWFEKLWKSAPLGNPFNVGIEGQHNFYVESQMHDDAAQSTDFPKESDDQTKFKMIFAIKEKYAELTRIDEQIRMLEELKANRSNISKDIAGLEGNYQQFVHGARHGL